MLKTLTYIQNRDESFQKYVNYDRGTATMIENSLALIYTFCLDKYMTSAIQLRSPPRAVHIGSLLRPKALFEKRLQLESKQCTPSDLKSVEDAAIKHVVELQRNVGIKTISDGELRRF